MPDRQSDIPSWTRSPWLKWSWLLVLVVVIAQSLDYHWRALPTSATGYYARGRADYLRRQYRDAIDNLTKSIDLKPQDADAYLLRGKAYAKVQDLGSAMPDLQKALALRPDYDKAHAAYADGKAAGWDTEGAIKEYSRALALDPFSGTHYLERGKILYDNERWDDAAADLRRAASVLLGDNQITAQLLLWVARARAGSAFSATAELSSVLAAGRIRGDRFGTNARFLCGAVSEQSHVASLPTLEGQDADERKAESYFLAGAKRLAFGDRHDGLTLMRNALRTAATSSYAYDRARVELESLLLGFHPMQLAGAERGLVVASVTPGGAAAAAGIRPGSTLTAIGGVGANRNSLLAFLANPEPGSTVELQLVGGDGSRMSVPLPLTPDSSAPTR